MKSKILILLVICLATGSCVKEKLETFYYAGRVYENCRRFEDAISMLLKAEENIEDDSWRTAALVYSSKASSSEIP